MFRNSEPREFQLTDAEVAALEVAALPADLKRLLKSEGASIGTRTQAFMKLAAAIRAERSVIEEQRLLNQARADLANLEAAERRLEQLSKENRALEKELHNTRQAHLRQIAAPAAAVDAAGTR